MDITRFVEYHENPTLTADCPDTAQQMLRMAIRAAMEVMTAREVREYCGDFITRHAPEAY